MSDHKGKVLWVDLGDRSHRAIPLEEKVIRDYIGGKGLGAYLLMKHVEKDLDPLSPASMLVFTVGPLTGTKAPTSNRYGVFFKSPLTGIWGESYSGGFLAPHIRRAGYQAIMITGISDKPIYLSIIDDQVEFHDASGIWGLDAFEAEDRVRDDLGDSKVRVMTIGQAGENLVRFACINNDYYRQLGRAGAGALMGSKRLKAIAIRGTQQVEIADPERFERLAEEVRHKIPKGAPISTLGTPRMVDLQNALGAFPTHYWQRGFFAAHERINAPTMKQLIVDRNKACWNCPVACGKMSSVKEGEYQGTTVEGPEYETIFAFGGLCEIGDIAAIAKINEVCDRIGVDTITAGNVIGFAMRAYELGRMKADFPIEFGDDKAVLKLLDMISRREGIGEVLSLGVREAASRLGLEDIAVHVKGLEPPGYDPRAYNGMALSYAIGVRGADHLRSAAYGAESAGISDRFAVLGKGAFVKDQEDKLAIIDSMIVCCFVRGAYEWDDLARLYTHATGIEMTVDDLRTAAMRIIDRARLFSTREGIGRKDDALPKIFHELPFSEGASRNHVVVKADLDKMVEDYYKARSWNENGVPSDSYESTRNE